MPSKALFASARQLYASVPFAFRMRLAFRSLVAWQANDVGRSIAKMLLDFGLDVPKNSFGAIDRTSPEIQELGHKVYQAVMSRTKSPDLTDEVISRQVMRFLKSKEKVVSDLQGTTFQGMFGYFITAFYRESLNFLKERGRRTQKEVYLDQPSTDDARPSEGLMEQAVQKHLEQGRNVEWWSHPAWARIQDDVKQEIARLDARQEEPRRGRPSRYKLPHLRLYELMLEQGLSAEKAAVVLIREESQFAGEDPGEMRHSLTRVRKALLDVVQTIVDNLKKDHLLDDFMEAVSA